MDLFVSTYNVIPLSESIGRRAYWLLKRHSRSDGLRPLDSLVAATALDHDYVLVTRNERHFRFIGELQLHIPDY